jgi:hypothetical protein
MALRPPQSGFMGRFTDGTGQDWVLDPFHLFSPPFQSLDYDKIGNVVGMEILDASARMENPRSVEYAVAK